VHEESAFGKINIGRLQAADCAGAEAVTIGHEKEDFVSAILSDGEQAAGFRRGQEFHGLGAIGGASGCQRSSFLGHNSGIMHIIAGID